MVTAMMIQTERPQEKRLRRYGLQLITSFWDEHTVRRRASDGSVRDDIKSGVILNKKYYRQGKLLHTETMFSPLMQYSFVVNDKLEKEPPGREGYYRLDISHLFRRYGGSFSTEEANNLFFTTAALRETHYAKQKNNAFYHMQAMDLPFQNIEFYYLSLNEEEEKPDGSRQDL